MEETYEAPKAPKPKLNLAVSRQSLDFEEIEDFVDAEYTIGHEDELDIFDI
jgi:hypothetical protein